MSPLVDQTQLFRVGLSVIMVGAGLILLFPDAELSAFVGAWLVGIGGLAVLVATWRRWQG